MIAVLEHPPRKPCACHDGALVAGVERQRVTAAMPDCICDVEVRRLVEEGRTELHAMHVWPCNRSMFKGRFEIGGQP